VQLWEGYRGLEEYAREVFPLEEAANGLKWMEEDKNHPAEESDIEEGRMTGGEEEDDDGEDSGSDDGLIMGGSGGGGIRGDAPARKQETWLA